jgi:hypothetical protein
VEGEVVFLTDGEGVGFAKLPIDARVDVEARGGIGKGFVDGRRVGVIAIADGGGIDGLENVLVLLLTAEGADEVG